MHVLLHYRYEERQAGLPLRHQVRTNGIKRLGEIQAASRVLLWSQRHDEWVSGCFNNGQATCEHEKCKYEGSICHDFSRWEEEECTNGCQGHADDYATFEAKPVIELCLRNCK